MKEIERLNPEQRTDLWRTVIAVMALSEEKRKEIVSMEDEHRKKMRDDSRKEMEETLQATGLQQLANEQRGRFFYRYFSERRSMEEKAKKQDETRRTALMSELGTKLKAEFGKPAPEVVTPVPEPERK